MGGDRRAGRTGPPLSVKGREAAGWEACLRQIVCLRTHSWPEPRRAARRPAGLCWCPARATSAPAAACRVPACHARWLGRCWRRCRGRCWPATPAGEGCCQAYRLLPCWVGSAWLGLPSRQAGHHLAPVPARQLNQLNHSPRLLPLPECATAGRRSWCFGTTCRRACAAWPSCRPPRTTRGCLSTCAPRCCSRPTCAPCRSSSR
jgi:hypothetical protein